MAWLTKISLKNRSIVALATVAIATMLFRWEPGRWPSASRGSSSPDLPPDSAALPTPDAGDHFQRSDS